MSQLRKLILVNLLVMSTCSVLSQDTTTFKLFAKSETNSGFGAVLFNMFQGKHFMIGGEGAAVFGNFYFGGFGYSGNIGNYTYPLSNLEYKLRKGSGGIILGGISNGDQFFAIYSDLKLSWDSYLSQPVDVNLNNPDIEYQGFSFLPSIGAAIRPTSFMKLRAGFGYNFSSIVDDGGLDNVPYRATMFNFSLTFGGF